ncbi:MAG: helix-turn-helix domain-containing protein [Terricaulis sp.]
MSLFFDVAWFESRLAALAMDQAGLAVALGVAPADLQRLFANERAPSAAELAALAEVLRVDLIEVTLRSGVAERGGSPGGGASARIESIEARLDAMDAWLEEFERSARKRA